MVTTRIRTGNHSSPRRKLNNEKGKSKKKKQAQDHETNVKRHRQTDRKTDGQTDKHLKQDTEEGLEPKCCR